jgi:hypothetical protein
MWISNSLKSYQIRLSLELLYVNIDYWDILILVVFLYYTEFYATLKIIYGI